MPIKWGLSTPWSVGLSRSPNLVTSSCRAASVPRGYYHSFCASGTLPDQWRASAGSPHGHTYQPTGSLPSLQLPLDPSQLPTLLCWCVSEEAGFAFLVPPVRKCACTLPCPQTLLPGEYSPSPQPLATADGALEVTELASQPLH